MNLRKIVLVFLVIVCLFACTKNKENKRPIKTEVEVEVKEPTTPEETEFYEPVPPTVNPTGQNGIPSDAIVLFNGEHLDHWVHTKDHTAAKWVLNEDGSMTVKDKSGDIQTKQEFDCIQLHLEWRSSLEKRASGQNRSNSGVFLQERYEVQVLDNNDNDTYVNGQVGSIYKQSIPLVKASVPTGEWNAYDIIYHAPEFNSEGEKTKSATITVLHNGVLIQDHYQIKGTTPYIGWPKNNPHGKAALRLQDHGDNSGVSYRNIWVRELKN